jgi:hypothetical protein
MTSGEGKPFSRFAGDSFTDAELNHEQAFE